jgi:fucokinase
VVNVAIDLNGRPPVAVRVRTTKELELRVESTDLGRSAEFSKRPFDRARLDAGDPFSLHTVALDMCGLLPPNSAAVVPFCRALGAGLSISTECRVPKGSGLGTSSILAATLLAALHTLRGRQRSRMQLLEETLILEQRLSTGGGWQDQVGGIFGGVKSTTTGPGVPQRPRVEALSLSSEILAGLEERLVVYYSGQQRLARDILRRVMGRWLAREPAVLLLMEELKESAANLRRALLAGRWARAGEEIARYWRIKKDLYPGSTTPALDVLFAQCRGACLSAGLAGAGGGGFAYFLCQDRASAARLRRQLAAEAAEPGSLGSVFETRINRHGLRVARREFSPRGAQEARRSD